MCCRERLHVTVFGKISSLSLERASNCTEISFFEGVSKYACMVRSLVSSSRVEFLSVPFPSSIGFTAVKNTACLHLLKLLPPGINNLFLIIEFNPLAFPTWPGFPLLCIGMSFCNRRASRNLHRFYMIRCFRFPRSPKIFG